MTMRTGVSGMGSMARYADFETNAFLRRVNRKIAAELTDAFLDDARPPPNRLELLERLAADEVERPPVVLDHELPAAGLFPEFHVDATGAGMLADVPQRFLQRAAELAGGPRQHPGGVGVRGKARLDAAL